MTSVNLKKTLEFFRSEEAYGLKILQSIIHVKEHFYIFFSPPEELTQAQNETNH